MDANEKELRALVEHLERSWNASDSRAWAEIFAEDADFIHILGGHYTGRAAVEQGHRTIFDTIYKGSVNRLEVEKIRLVGRDCALVFILATLKFRQGDSSVTMQTRPTLIAERRGDRWEIAAFQNTAIKDAAGDAIQERLAKEHPFQGKSAGQS